MTSRSFARWLTTWPDDRLADLVALRLGRLARLASSFDELAILLSHPGSCDEALRVLDRTAVQVIGTVARAGGQAEPSDVATTLGAAEQQVLEALDRAASVGLAWPDGSSWRTPGGLLHLVGTGSGQAAEHPPEHQPAPIAEPPAVGALRLVSRGRELLAVLTPPPTPLAAGGLGVQALRRLAKVAGAPLDDVVLLLQLLAAAGLVGVGQQAGAVSPAGQRWLQLPEEQAYARLVAPQLHPRAVLEPAGGSLSGLLSGVARMGYALPTVRQVAQAAVVRGPETDASLIGWLDWSRWRRGSSGARLAGWERPLAVLDLLALRAGGTPAPWLAPLLDLEPQGLIEELVEGELACATAVLAEHLPPAQDDAVVQADGTLVVGGRAGEGLRQLLGQVAVREADHQWRVCAEQVRGALDAGCTGADLLAELQARSRHELPAVVERLVLDVARDHGRIRVHAAACVLDLDDPLLAVELLHDPRLAPLGLRELAPGVLTSTATAAGVVTALRKAGHAPVGDGAAPPPPPPPPAVRVARPRVQLRTWGHAADEVVVALRAAPPERPPPDAVVRPPDVVPPPAPVRAPRLAGQLVQLTQREQQLVHWAVASGEPVEIDYVDSAGMPTTRVVELLEDTGHLLQGWCRLRQAGRTFDPGGILRARRPGA